MSAPAVVFDGVWKKFRKGERHDSLRDLIPSTLKRLVRRPESDHLREQEFWALRDVSFDVKPGMALGIIGPNGAGKSTALKLLTKILKPTRGRCELRGRVGALIELAAGFHPDLTGRENIYLQGAIMGMTRHDIAQRFDAIVAFAGVESFVDTQVKRYSSGMQARLGFSIAAHLEPHVLLIDEVLSVGDMRFQERCTERMLAFKDAGAAIVFISHTLSAISTLCDDVLVLKSGERRLLAGAAEAIAAYSSIATPAAPSAAPTHSSSSAIEIDVDMTNDAGQSTRTIAAGQTAHLRAVIDWREAPTTIDTAIRVRSLSSGDQVFFTVSRSVRCEPLLLSDGGEVQWTLQMNLADGHYSIEFIVIDASTHAVLRRLLPAVTFQVREADTHAGTAYLKPRCTAHDRCARPA